MIVITRPKQTALQLVAQLKRSNVEAIAFPLIELAAMSLSNALQEQLKKVCQQVHPTNIRHIFISPNAVHFSSSYLQKYLPNNSNEVYAIGKQTAEKLTNLGYKRINIAPPPYNSEALLSLEKLKNSRHGNHCFLWCGLEGRKLLARDFSNERF